MNRQSLEEREGLRSERGGGRAFEEKDWFRYGDRLKNLEGSVRTEYVFYCLRIDDNGGRSSVVSLTSSLKHGGLALNLNFN